MSSTISGIFELPDREVDFQTDSPCLLTEAAAEADVVLDVACGGKGACGSCAVDLLAGRYADAAGEPIDLPDGRPRRVLACQTRLLAGPFRVRVPRHSLVEAGEKVVVEFEQAPAHALRPPVRKEHLSLPAPTLADQRGNLERLADGLRARGLQGPIVTSLPAARAAAALGDGGFEATATVTHDAGAWHVIRIEPGQAGGPLYGAAVDIGTTTVVVALVDLSAGEIVDAASCYNRQIVRNDNVGSRISFAETDEGLADLRRLVVERTINRLLGLLRRRHGLEADDVAHLAVAGNTVMAHLFCGLSPKPLGAVPFAPITNFPGPWRAGELSVAMNPAGFVDVAPSVSAYVGGDITSDMFVCGVASRSESTVLVDIGTNAEIVVGNRHRLIACAVVVKDGGRIWHHIESAKLTVRPLSEAFIEHYLDAVGEAAFDSVGAYQLEGVGAQLFARVQGDYFTVLGLPLLPLMDLLRNHGVLPS